MVYLGGDDDWADGCLEGRAGHLQLDISPTQHTWETII